MGFSVCLGFLTLTSTNASIGIMGAAGAAPVHDAVRRLLINRKTNPVSITHQHTNTPTHCQAEMSPHEQIDTTDAF